MMEEYSRYAIYHAPPAGPLAAAAARWLGWDPAQARELQQPEAPGLDLARITSAPRKYGFHGTLKPPFRLAPDQAEDALFTAFDRLCTQMPAAIVDGLELAALGRFIALVPRGNAIKLQGVAAMTVETLDSFRAPPTEAELAKRRAAGLSERQEALLERWGYPYVMDEFRFHMTLSSKLPKDRIEPVKAVLAQQLDGRVPEPFTLDGLSLVGEGEDGFFHLIQRHTFPA